MRLWDPHRRYTLQRYCRTRRLAYQLVREDHIEWNAPSKPRPLLQRILAPDAGVATGWKSFAISELPRVFRRYFAPERRHWFVARSYGPSGAWWLRARVEGQFETLLRSRVLSAEKVDGRARLQVETRDAVSVIETEHAVAATGFQVDIDRLEFLEPTLARGIAREAPGIPALDSRFETSVPGLFVVGAASAPVFGPDTRYSPGFPDR